MSGDVRKYLTGHHWVQSMNYLEGFCDKPYICDLRKWDCQLRLSPLYYVIEGSYHIYIYFVGCQNILLVDLSDELKLKRLDHLEQFYVRSQVYNFS